MGSLFLASCMYNTPSPQFTCTDFHLSFVVFALAFLPLGHQCVAGQIEWINNLACNFNSGYREAWRIEETELSRNPASNHIRGQSTYLDKNRCLIPISEEIISAFVMHDHADVAQMLKIELVASQGHYAYNSDFQLFSGWWDAGQKTVIRKTDSTWLSFTGRHETY